MSSRDKEKISLSWSFYDFLRNTCNCHTWETSALIATYGLDNEEAYNVAKENEISISDRDMKEFFNHLKK